MESTTFAVRPARAPEASLAMPIKRPPDSLGRPLTPTSWNRRRSRCVRRAPLRHRLRCRLRGRPIHSGGRSLRLHGIDGVRGASGIRLTLPWRCRSTSRWAWSASRISRSSSGTVTTPTVRIAAPRTCANSSPSSRLTAPPSNRASARPVAVVAAEAVAATELSAFATDVAGCTKCRLAQGRTQVVFGVGDPNADLMFVGEAPGYHEDQQGKPFVGQAGKLLDNLLAAIGLARDQVYVANVLKCRPPGNRDPQPDEIEACESHLFRQISLIEPKVVATLGNFATKLLSGKPTGITRVHGAEQETRLGGRRVLLYPLYHPAAALYTPAMLKVLEEDFARLPALLGRVVEEPKPMLGTLVPEPAVQLGLF